MVYALALQVPMENGERSIGRLCMREVDAFETMIDLSDESTLVSYQLLRNDGSFLVRNSESLGSTFYDTLKSCATTADGGPIDPELRQFKAAILNNTDHLVTANPCCGLPRAILILTLPLSSIRMDIS